MKEPRKLRSSSAKTRGAWKARRKATTLERLEILRSMRDAQKADLELLERWIAEIEEEAEDPPSE